MVWLMASPAGPSRDPDSQNYAIDLLNIPVENGTTIEENLEMRELISTDEELDNNGLKLGLGDFVFYSVLVGRASLYNWVTTVATTLAVISGLVLTIFILILKRRPLPALPISIFFGLTVFLVGSLSLSPMIESLLILSRQDNIIRAGSAKAYLIYL
jgi:hypothetical protein